MRRIVRWGLALLLVFGLAHLAERVLVGMPKHPATPEQLRASVKREVPLGASRAQVEQWLDSKEVEYSYLAGKDLEFETDVLRSGHKPGELDGMIGGILRDTSRSFLMGSDIRLVFFFDKAGRLTDYSVKAVGTGP